MNKLIILENEILYVEINPILGGSIKNFFIKNKNIKIPVFREASNKIRKKDDVLLNSFFSLIPFSGRIGNALLKFKSKTYNLKKNFKGELSALHGDGWQNPWIVKNLEKNCVIMKLSAKNKNWPFKYSGHLIIKINNNELKISLEIKNLDIKSMPCGLGLHPWFDMTANASLQMNAKKFWIVGKDNLFKKVSNLSKNIDFSRGKKLINTNLVNGFSEWNGFATIVWPEKKLSLNIESSKNLKHLIVYTPYNENFFCIEPVSHSVDAFNLYAKGIKGTGTKILRPNKIFKVVTSFKPKIIH